MPDTKTAQTMPAIAPAIAIDGHSASGKGTLARRLGGRLGFAVLDTGKLYRLIGMMAHDQNIATDDEDALAHIATRLNDTLRLDQLADPALGSDMAGKLASRTSKFPKVRAALVQFQRDFAANPPALADGTAAKGVILDGRDIGTVILPDAPVKFFVTASADVRAERRFAELKDSDPDLTYEQVYLDMAQRDERDQKRAASPLVAAADAVTIDTSDMTADEVETLALRHIDQKRILSA